MTEIQDYNDKLSESDKQICDELRTEIDKNLESATSKIWHGSPVWFIDGNPIVGYSKLKNCVQLLFWSGQSFEESGLLPKGSFKAAECRYTSSDQLDKTSLMRWLKKAQKIQWDYKNIVKNKGKLYKIS